MGKEGSWVIHLLTLNTTYTYNLCKCGIIGKSMLNLSWWYENIRQTKWINILQDKS